jgi:polygalacturonase
MIRHNQKLIGLLALSGVTACSGFGGSFTDYPDASAQGTGGQSGSGGSAGSSGGSETPADAASNALDAANALADAADAAPFSIACDDAELGPEPTIADPCATLTATRTLTNGTPTDETTVDTKLIQDAINACPAGQSVKLVADGDNAAFLSGPLFMRAGVTLWVDAGVTLFATRNPLDFDAGRAGLCGAANSSNSTCYALINVAGMANVSIVGAGTLDGRGGEPMTGGDSGGLTWWQMEDASDGTMAGPRIIQVAASSNFTLYQLTLRNSPKFHVVIDRSNGYRVWGITVNTPANSPNTDAVDPSASTNGIIAYNKLTTGDDNIAIKGGGPGPIDGLIIAHNHFGRGHGMSIGSETNGNVRNVRVCDLSLDGTQNGIRIKSDSSRGGIVERIGYSDICMRGVRNPLVFDPYYSSSTGTLIPIYRNIVVKNAHVLGAGNLKITGYDATRPLVLALDNVVFDMAPTVTASNANLTFGPGPVSFAATGTGVNVTQLDTIAADPRACDDAWVTF